MNVIFISPHFPLYFYNFCDRLKARGIHVLGIGDASYDSISQETKDSLTEYYKVDNLENYEEVYRACAYFTWRYGHIDWIESQNEYWLELEATLRNEFNVTVIVNPDNGVGASSTYKLKNDDELDYFFSTKDPHIQFIIEEMVPGHVETFDGVTDSQKNILISTSHVMLNSIMDNVNEASDTAFYSQPVEGLDLAEIGKKAVDAFQAKSRFFHFEFFRLDEDREGLGKKGDIVGLEVNMRAPGAYMPDMTNYAYDVDVYTIWADMIKFDQCYYDLHREYWVAYTGRRDGIWYAHNYDQIRAKYGDMIALETDVPEALAAAMGNHVFITKAHTQEELFEQIRYILKREDGKEWM